MMKSKIAILLLASAAALSSCSEKGWSVKGTINNAPDDTKVAVEGFNAGMWYNIDSVEVAKDGTFSYVSPQGSAYPDIYRVSLGGKSIYFPIDSLENITITADASNFDTDYNVSGWQLAEEMMQIDQKISKAISEKGTAAVLNDSILKRELSIAINEDENGILGYYIINKTVGNLPLFSTADRADLRVLGSLANKFKTKYPDDPRTEYLCQLFLQSRSQFSTAGSRVIEANEAGMFEIDLFDAKGNKQKLSDLAKNSGLTLLSFTSYQIEPSVAYNVELNRMYEKYKDRNLAIYQVSIDSDELQWRTSAVNLPWTAVWYDGKDGGALLRMYNVAAVPMTYVLDHNGDLVDRVDDPADLETVIRKHM